MYAALIRIGAVFYSHHDKHTNEQNRKFMLLLGAADIQLLDGTNYAGNGLQIGCSGVF